MKNIKFKRYTIPYVWSKTQVLSTYCDKCGSSKIFKKIFNKIYKNLKYIEILKILGLADIFTVLRVIVRQQIY